LLSVEKYVRVTVRIRFSKKFALFVYGKKGAECPYDNQRKWQQIKYKPNHGNRNKPNILTVTLITGLETKGESYVEKISCSVVQR